MLTFKDFIDSNTHPELVATDRMDIAWERLLEVLRDGVVKRNIYMNIERSYGTNWLYIKNTPIIPNSAALPSSLSSTPVNYNISASRLISLIPRKSIPNSTMYRGALYFADMESYQQTLNLVAKSDPSCLYTFLNVIIPNTALASSPETHNKPVVSAALAAWLFLGEKVPKKNLNAKLFFQSLELIYENISPRQQSVSIISDIIRKYKAHTSKPSFLSALEEFFSKTISNDGISASSVLGRIYQQTKRNEKRENEVLLCPLSSGNYGEHNLIMFSADSNSIHNSSRESLLLNKAQIGENCAQRDGDFVLSNVLFYIVRSSVLNKYGVIKVFSRKQSKTLLSPGNDDVFISFILKDKKYNTEETQNIVSYLMEFSLRNAGLLLSQKIFNKEEKERVRTLFEQALTKRTILQSHQEENTQEIIKIRASKKI